MFGSKTINFYGLHLTVVDEERRLAVIDSGEDYTEFVFTHELFKPGDRVLVAGGGMGSVAAWTAMRVGASNTIIFEPNPELVRSLVKNVLFEGQVPHVFCGALDIEDGQQTFYIRDQHWGGSSLYPGDHTREIQVQTYDINSVIKKFRIGCLSLDIEGAELEIIPHLNLTSIRAIMVEIHADLLKANEVTDYLRSQGFKVKNWHTQAPYHALHVLAVER